MDEHLLEVYLINTARHTEETPVAEWVSLPTDAETMKAVFERLGVDGSDTEQYQVSAFHSSLDGWSEALKPGESLDDLNYLARCCSGYSCPAKETSIFRPGCRSSVM